jgi:hypothetical protein
MLVVVMAVVAPAQVFREQQEQQVTRQDQVEGVVRVVEIKTPVVLEG